MWHALAVLMQIIGTMLTLLVLVIIGAVIAEMVAEAIRGLKGETL